LRLSGGILSLLFSEVNMKYNLKNAQIQIMLVLIKTVLLTFTAVNMFHIKLQTYSNKNFKLIKRCNNSAQIRQTRPNQTMEKPTL